MAAAARSAAVLAGVVLATGVFATGASAVAPGALFQLSDPLGCLAESGNGTTCTDGHGLVDPFDIKLSPDGKFAYATSSIGGSSSSSSDAITVYSRNSGTGALTQLADPNGCMAETGDGVSCVDGFGLDEVFQLTVSPDGKSVYAVSLTSDTVTVFSRNAGTGVLTEIGCFSNAALAGCTDVQGLLDPDNVAVSPDGTSVYVASDGVSSGGVQGGFLAIFARDTGTGALTFKGCLSETGADGCPDVKGIDGSNEPVVSPDGKFVYVVALFTDGTDMIQNGGSVAEFSRDPNTGLLTQLADPNECIAETGADGCADGKGLNYAHSIVMSPDGKFVYTAAAYSAALAAFSRNPTTGALTQLPDPNGCVAENGDGVTCVDGKSLNQATDLTITNDGKFVYGSAFGGSSIGAFSRDAATGVLSQLPGKDGCIIDTGGGSSSTCNVGHSIFGR